MTKTTKNYTKYCSGAESEKASSFKGHLWWYPSTIPVIMSLWIHFVTLSVPVQMKKNLSCARWKLKGFSYWSFSVRLPLSGTTFLLTSNTAILSHSSKLLLKPFSLLQPTLSYSNPFTGIGCCTWFLSFFFCCCLHWWWLIIFGGVVGGGGLGVGVVERDWERERKVSGCEIVCVWVYMCVHAGEGEG